MRARNGKIARLPVWVRQELNGRLYNGQEGKQVVDWLNGLPLAQQVLAEGFGGKPISEQNLSEWRQGGYVEWEERRYLFEDADEVWAQGDDVRRCREGLVDRLVHVLGARYAQLLLHWDGEVNEVVEKKAKLLCRLSRDVLALQRGVQRETRLELWQVEHRLRVEEVERKKAAWKSINATIHGARVAVGLRREESSQPQAPGSREASKSQRQKGAKSKGIKPNQTVSGKAEGGKRKAEKQGTSNNEHPTPNVEGKEGTLNPEPRTLNLERGDGDSRAGRPRSDAAVQNAAESEGIKPNQTELVVPIRPEPRQEDGMTN